MLSELVRVANTKYCVPGFVAPTSDDEVYSDLWAQWIEESLAYMYEEETAAMFFSQAPEGYHPFSYLNDPALDGWDDELEEADLPASAGMPSPTLPGMTVEDFREFQRRVISEGQPLWFFTVYDIPFGTAFPKNNGYTHSKQWGDTSRVFYVQGDQETAQAVYDSIAAEHPNVSRLIRDIPLSQGLQSSYAWVDGVQVTAPYGSAEARALHKLHRS